MVGGLGMIQVIRYSESPVGPYDELLVVPGNFEHPFAQKEGSKNSNNLRLTRIYVSQERTCWNGRTSKKIDHHNELQGTDIIPDWNIPKHIARFEFKQLSNGGVFISVFPLQSDISGVESKPSGTPFFQATYKDIPYIPRFPSSTGLFKYVGLDLSLVQPPLPEGKGAPAELPGTKNWCKISPAQHSSKTSLGWWDLQRRESTELEPLLSREDGGASTSGGYENWWPGIGRWRIGMKMEDATIIFPEGEYWDNPVPVS